MQTAMARCAMAGWPQGLITIAEIVGEEAAAKLSDTYGGFRIHVPKQAAGRLLAEVIGLEAATALAQIDGGNRIYVPNRAAALSKKAAIAGAEGSVAGIARSLGVSERWARKVRQQMRPRPSPTSEDHEA